jgi:hypothetical protein
VDLPRQDLADAALAAATAAGASHADLRVHRSTTEIIQLRDGELETACAAAADPGLSDVVRQPGVIMYWCGLTI